MALGLQKNHMKLKSQHAPSLPFTLLGHGGKKWPVGGQQGPSRAGGFSSWSRSPPAGPHLNGEELFKTAWSQPVTVVDSPKW